MNIKCINLSIYLNHQRRIYFSLIIVSDTCSVDETKDLSGPTLVRLVTNKETKTGQILKGHVSYKAIVPDEKKEIEV